MKIHRSINKPIRENLSWKDRWEGADRGLIACWESGRKKRAAHSELATKAKRNELPILEWKGGLEKTLQGRKKYGTLNYLAQWQGLRGEDLSIDTEVESQLTCSRTDMLVTYTSNSSKYLKS